MRNNKLASSINNCCRIIALTRQVIPHECARALEIIQGVLNLNRTVCCVQCELTSSGLLGSRLINKTITALFDNTTDLRRNVLKFENRIGHGQTKCRSVEELSEKLSTRTTTNFLCAYADVDGRIGESLRGEEVLPHAVHFCKGLCHADRS